MPTRRITYADQLANSLFAMQDAKQRMLDAGFLAQAILGITTQLAGFACTPSGTPDLTVHVAGGTIFKNQNVDDTDFGSPPSQIPADTVNQIVKYATQLGNTPFTITPPGTVGFSRNDLIQINFQEADGDSENIPFWNGTDVNGRPNPPVFHTENVLRIDSVVISILTGTAATTGTQVTPTPTAGFVGAWVITTAEGQTTITSGNIAAYSGAPFLLDKLKDKITFAQGDTRYALQANGLPVAAMLDFGGTSAPTGFLLCDGSAVSRTTYAALFAAIGVNWGSGDGSTTFNVPDIRGRTSIGAGTGSGLSARTLGQTGGEEEHLLIIAEMPSHTHDFAETVAAGNVFSAGTNYTNTNEPTSSTGGDSPHNNMQPFAVVTKIIKF